MIKNIALGFCRKVKAVVLTGLAVVGALFFTAPAAKAQSFDYTSYATTLTTGAGAVATAATLLAGIMAGVIVWKKIAKYFNKAG